MTGVSCSLLAFRHLGLEQLEGPMAPSHCAARPTRQSFGGIGAALCHAGPRCWRAVRGSSSKWGADCSMQSDLDVITVVHRHGKGPAACSIVVARSSMW